MGFNDDKIYTSINLAGTGLECPSKEDGAVVGYTVNNGWLSQNSHPRFLAQIDLDANKEIVGFGGNYVKVMNDCINGSGATDFRMGDISTDNNAVEATSVKLNCYPNPFTNAITIDFNTSAENANVIIFNSIGSKIKEATGTFSANTFSFSGENLENGTYFCILYENGKITAKKSIVLAH